VNCCEWPGYSSSRSRLKTDEEVNWSRSTLTNKSSFMILVHVSLKNERKERTDRTISIFRACEIAPLPGRGRPRARPARGGAAGAPLAGSRGRGMRHSRLIRNIAAVQYAGQWRALGPLQLSS
jgi:hypothetical protein